MWIHYISLKNGQSWFFMPHESCVFETSFTLSIADDIISLVVKADIDLGREQGVVDLSLGLWE